VRVLRQVDPLAVDRQIAQVELHALTEPGDVEQAEPVELGRGLADLRVEPEHVGGLVVEPERDAAVPTAGVGALPPAVLIVPVEVFEQALVAGLEQPLVELLACQVGLLLLDPLEEVSSPCSS
jgi:hypothetical protein